MPSSATEIYTLSLHDALPISVRVLQPTLRSSACARAGDESSLGDDGADRAEHRSVAAVLLEQGADVLRLIAAREVDRIAGRDQDRKSTRLNSSHLGISYAVFCHRDLHSFPTRRSSDLRARIATYLAQQRLRSSRRRVLPW